MKYKKSAFSHSSTGYGKSRHSNSGVHHHQKNNNNLNTKSEKQIDKDVKNIDKLDQEKELNSGFGDYLRSAEAVEMMKLFVFANTIMLILTMAWPNVKEQYYMLRHWLTSFQTME